MNRYSIFALVYLFGFLAMLCGCKSGDVVPSLPADHYVLNKNVLFPTTAGINVIADTVNISICPPNAYCIALNSASASVRLIQNTETRLVRLFTFFSDGVKRDPGAFASDSTSVRFGSQLYKVILKARYINGTENGKSGQAILQVSKL